jgi:hypothetical protein
MTNRSEKAVTAMTFFQFQDKFPDEKAAIDYFLDIRYKGELTWPYCGAKVSIYRYRDRPKFFQRSDCNNTFSPFKDTVFAKNHIDMRRWFFAMWSMLQRIRRAMANKETEEQFELFVERDETYIGGKPRKPNAVLDKDGNKDERADLIFLSPKIDFYIDFFNLPNKGKNYAFFMKENIKQ